MSFICKNGTAHKHESVTESKICWGILKAPSYGPVVPLPPIPTVDWSRWYPKDGHRPRRPEGMSTWKQLDYIADLGGDPGECYRLRWEQASAQIVDLQTLKKKAKIVDPRLDLLKGMIDMIPDGYYAVEAEAGAETQFLRLKRPKTGTRTYGDALKIQTQHGPRLDLAAVLWPSGNWTIHKHSIVDALLLLVTDHHGAAIRYAQKLGCCMRCNCELTDHRSRWYGIGPECETKYGWEWVIATRDELKGGSYEELARRGLLPV